MDPRRGLCALSAPSNLLAGFPCLPTSGSLTYPPTGPGAVSGTASRASEVGELPSKRDPRDRKMRPRSVGPGIESECPGSDSN
jgi:hypothetical protein